MPSPLATVQLFRVLLHFIYFSVFENLNEEKRVHCCQLQTPSQEVSGNGKQPPLASGG